MPGWIQSSHMNRNIFFECGSRNILRYLQHKGDLPTVIVRDNKAKGKIKKDGL